MARKKSLQKFTEIEKKIDALFELEEISKEDLSKLNTAEEDAFWQRINDNLQNLKGTKRDKFISQTDKIFGNETKNKLWEYNNSQIMNYLIKYIEECGCMPYQLQIAENTGLSRQTIHKHIKEIAKSELYQAQIEQFKFMVPKLLAQLMRQAIKGDTKAAKLLLEYTIENPTKKVGTQNNYIQINGMVFNDEKLKMLKPEQLKSIETILLTANHEQPLFENCNISEGN